MQQMLLCCCLLSDQYNASTFTRFYSHRALSSGHVVYCSRCVVKCEKHGSYFEAAMIVQKIERKKCAMLFHS